MKTLFRICRTLALLIFLAGCAPANSLATVTPTPTRLEPTQTPEFEGIADCRWSGTAFVWIDQNGDGEYQEGEQPVPDVSVMIDDALNGYTDVGEKAKTSLEGEANLSVWLPGCPNVAFEFYIEVPDGYVLTTAPRIKKSDTDDGFSFGLTYLPGVSTATPLPPSPECNIHPLPRDLIITDFSIDDGTIWIGAKSNGIYRQLAGQTAWTHWREQDGLISDDIWSIEAGYGHVWIATSSGVSTFDGEAWESYTEKNGLASNMVSDVAIEKNGSVWLATYEGISYFSSANKSWRSFSQFPGLRDSFFDSVEIASDGTIWFIADITTALRLFWPDRTGDPEWQIYFNNAIDVPFLPTWDLAADVVGNVWFVGYGGFTRFNVLEDVWTPQYFETDMYYLEKEFWHVTPDIDGSIWIADQSRLYHYFPSGTKSDRDVMLEYSTGGNVPDIGSLVAIEVGQDGRVWLILERQMYECEFFD